MLKPAKQPHIRLTALFLCVTMFLSTLFFNAHTAYAADGTIDYKAGAKIPYGDYYTSRMSFDGNNTAYCVEPLKKTPASGKYPYNLLGKNSPLRKALYYLNGGYGYEKVIKDQYFQGWSDDNSYVIGHLVVSYIHAGNNGDTGAFHGAPQNYIDKALEVANAIEGLPAPPESFRAFIVPGNASQTFAGSWYQVPNGFIELQKSSANTDISDKNGNYSLEGAKYGIYKGEELVETLVTDKKGYAKSKELAEGSYTVKEISAPEGFAIDPSAHNVTVKAEGTSTVKVKDIPQNNPVKLLLKKLDADTQQNSAQGTGSLANAEFTIKFYTEQSATDPGANGKKPVRTWILKTDASGEIHFTKDYLVSGDEFFYASDGKTVCFPLGTVTVQETKAPAGYLPNESVFVQQITSTGTEETISIYNAYRGDETKAPEGYLNEGKLSQEFHITENGKILDLTAKETAISNQVIRGDLEFVKVSDGDLNRLANVPFSITSKTTGESHTIVTDKNGYASTSSEWNKHTTNTNRGETSEDGIWFGSSKPDDTKGALIYDTYILEEQRCDSNEGMNLLKIEVSVYKNHVVVDMGTLTDDQITIGTTALDKDSNSHFAKPEEKITLVDTVEYEGLKKGQSYKLIGTLMDQESGKPIEIDGKPVTAETTFKPKKSSGSAKVTFTFNASSLKGKTIVVFEELYQEDLKLAVHADITDQDQTIYFPEIGTTAKDKETDMNLSQADKEVTLVDTVAYKNLLPGEEYVMTGTLMDKETGKPVEIDKKEVTAETTFTPKESSGTVDVIFSFDGTSLAGKTVVVFESATYDGKEFATHADLEDNGQTIYFPEIATTAKDKADGDHFAKTDKEITIVDTVKYSNLIPGKEYALTGTLMDKETKEPLQADGKPITATTTFTPEDASGSIELTFTFDGSILSGKTIVVFESLTYQEKEIAVHADIEDHEQSIYFPGIGTTAKDKADGDQEAVATKEVTIIDTVSYQNLIPDTPYKLVGTLMDKTTQKEVMIDGKPVTAETEFTPKDSNGSVEVIFTFDGSTLAGHDVVVFEKLFSLEGETALEIASHEDLDDKGQTIKLTEAPKDTPEPSKPVKTGDETTVLPYLLLAGAALLFAAGFGILYIRKRKKDK